MKQIRNHCADPWLLAGRKFTGLVLCACLLGVGGLPAWAEVQFGGEFWVATNATRLMFNGGVVYSNATPVTGGTLANPLDGSSQANFDQNMNNLPPGATIHLLAGLYHTAGYGGTGTWLVKSQQKILGSGIDNTILQLVNPATSQVWSMRSSTGTNMVVRDLTLDANGTNGVLWHEGVELSGSVCTVSHVKIIDCSSTGYEVFGIGIQSSGSGNLIEDCEVSHFLGGGGISAIQMTASSSMISGIIQNNRIYLDTQPAYFGINAGGINNSLIEGNFIQGAAIGIYCDTGGITNVLVTHNFLKDCVSGVSWGNTNVWQNNTLSYNMITLTNGGLVRSQANVAPAAFYIASGSSATNINIIGNTVKLDGPVGAIQGPLFVMMANVTGLNVYGNTVDDVLTNWFIANVNNLNMYNNVDPYGFYLSQDNNSTGNYPLSPMGFALLASTNAAQVLTSLGLPASPATILTNNNVGSVKLNGPLLLTNSSGSPLLSLQGSAGQNAAVILGSANQMWAVQEDSASTDTNLVFDFFNGSNWTTTALFTPEGDIYANSFNGNGGGLTFPYTIITNNYTGRLTLNGPLTLTNSSGAPGLTLQGTAAQNIGVVLGSANQLWALQEDSAVTDTNLVFRFYNGTAWATLASVTPGGNVTANSFTGTFTGNGGGLTFPYTIITNNYTGRLTVNGPLTLTNSSGAPGLTLQGTAVQNVGVVLGSANQLWTLQEDSAATDTNLVFRFFNGTSWATLASVTPGGNVTANSFTGTFTGNGGGLTFPYTIITNNFTGRLTVNGALNLTNSSGPPGLTLQGTAAQNVGIVWGSANQLWTLQEDSAATDTNLVFRFFNGTSWATLASVTPGGNVTANSFTGTFTGNGGGLTNLNASQLTAGTVPLAQLPGSVVTNTAGSVTLSGTLSATACFVSNNAVCPSPLGGGGWLWNSNNVLYWVTSVHTNYLTGP